MTAKLVRGMTDSDLLDMHYFIDALTDDRQHIKMQSRRYTAPSLTSTCYVVCQSYKKIISEGR